MLSDEERKRLEKRTALSSEKRAVNDYRVKKKLLKWLDAAPDALRALSQLPMDRIRNDLSDVDIYRLLTIIRYLLWAKEFMAVHGTKDAPEEWEAIGYGITRPVNSTDIGRTIILEEHIGELREFIGPENPIPFAKGLSRIINDPDIDDILNISPAAKRGAERIIKGEKEYLENFK